MSLRGKLATGITIGAIAYIACISNPQYKSIDDIMPKSIPRIVQKADFSRNLGKEEAYAASVAILYGAIIGVGYSILKGR